MIWESVNLVVLALGFVAGLVFGAWAVLMALGE